MRRFIDSNVIVYANDASAPEKQARARAALAPLLASNDGCVSVQVLQEVYVTLTRKVANPDTPEVARAVIADLGAWRVHAPDAAAVLRAIDLSRSARISLWDAMIVRSAAALGCEELLTEDLNPGQRIDGVLIVDPFAQP